MAKGNSWTISDSNGMNHSISCKVKTFGGPEISVDTNTYITGRWLCPTPFRKRAAGRQ